MSNYLNLGRLRRVKTKQDENAKAKDGVEA